MVGLTPLFGPVGPEILIVIALIILLFGANKLPEVARATGKSLSEFKKGQVDGKENTKVFPELKQSSQDTKSRNAQNTPTNSESNISPPDQDTTDKKTTTENGHSGLEKESKSPDKPST